MRKSICVGLLLLGCVALVSVAGCKSACRPGYQLVDGLCKRAGDGTGDTGTEIGAAAAAGRGGELGQGVQSDSRASAVDGSNAAVPSASDASSSAGVGAAAAPTNAVAGSSGAGLSSGSSDSGASPAMDLCAGRDGEAVCDDARLHHCGVGGVSESQEDCASASLCQIGLSAGACAVCNPGSFQCDGARLDVCADTGQYMTVEECATPELCKAEAGLCTEMVCAPNAVTCSSDGATLNICNADGSAFADQESCQGKGCNSAQMSCNSCMPGEKTCNGAAVETCNADGQTTATMACTASNECSIPTCDAGRCVSERMPAGSPCSRGKCDSTGRCVACLDASDCPAGNACVTPTCSAGVCRQQNVRSGTECGSNMECDGSGRCTEKDPCDDDVFDPTMEECDPTSPEWRNSGGACDNNCKLTARAYQACPSGGESCWGAQTGWFCSAVGACSRVCRPGDRCPPGGTCMVDNARPSQGLCVTTSCQPGTQLQWYGREGCQGPASGHCMGAIVPQRMCGWVSADPTGGTLWCPAENSGQCCAPGGGGCVPKTPQQ